MTHASNHAPSTGESFEVLCLLGFADEIKSVLAQGFDVNYTNDDGVSGLIVNAHQEVAKSDPAGHGD